MTDPQVSFLVLDFLKPVETRLCLQSIRQHALIPHKIIYLDNGGGAEANYPWQYYRERLCDVLISKWVGGGGGVGQTDLFRCCDTPYAIFVQSDQILAYDITDEVFAKLTDHLDRGFHCVDLNGDQSNRGVWTDRSHLIKTDFFNSLAPFPNGGPGADAKPWNEAYLQKRFAEDGYKIAHVKPALFVDNGKWSIREAGDGLYKHRCDTKQMWILKRPTYSTEVYPPFTVDEWDRVLKGEWVDGEIPERWKECSFTCWPS